METAKQQSRAAQQEIGRLKERLARTLGDEVAAAHPEHVSSNAVNDLHAQIERLLASQVDLRRQLRDTAEELEAARALNRIRERNSNMPEAPA
jgi:glycosyltransferase A (GT-A) superfamily protein (DUF2064 family)